MHTSKLLSHLAIPFCLLLSVPMTIQAQYKRPAPDVAAIADAPGPPIVGISPVRDALLETDINFSPSIATLAKPFLKLAGLRVDPELNAKQRITEYTGCTVDWFLERKKVKIALPEGIRLAGAPIWSPDGSKIAFGVDGRDGVELWAADARTGKAWRIEGLRLNDVLNPAISWMEDSERLFVRAVPAGRGPAPAAVALPTGPSIEETAGKQSKVMTFQDLLRNENDERLFEHYATNQMALVQAVSGKIENFGAPGLHAGAMWSRDENFVLVTSLRRPFSYRVTFANFARKTEVFDKKGHSVAVIAQLPVTDEIPPQGVVTGPRGFQWQAHEGARLLWSEALDGGDPTKKVESRDKIMALDAPFTGEPRELFKTKHRFSGFGGWLPKPGQVMFSEYDRDRRWATTYLADLTNPAAKTTLFDLSVNDDYNDPGTPVTERLPNGDYVVAMDGDEAYYDCGGASPEGEFPRLDKINLKTGQKTTVWQSPKNAREEFFTFVGKERKEIITRHESKTEVPNFFRTGLAQRSHVQLTEFSDPALALAKGIEKRLVKYLRPDGVPLSGTLMLPPGRKPGEKLPLFIWAYPLEYSDKSTAGQVRGSENTYTFLRGNDPEFFVTQGYAVLMDATIPIVGDPETMNNTFVEQAITSGRAAIDYLADTLGLVDRNRVGVGGHSYGAFMTANLLAHSDDYAYGIARSGAYNRTLTPFGFQSERRSFWEAKDVYMNVSPFYWADKIKAPLLLVHGDADNNPGTHTVQSERLYQAIKGTGGTARLVLLPHESHGYRARESQLHVLAEMFEWAEKHGTRKAVGGEVKRP